MDEARFQIPDSRYQIPDTRFSLLPLRQTDAWAKFMTGLGWQTERVGPTLVLIKKFPFRLGSFIKILDAQLPLDWPHLFGCFRNHQAHLIKIQTVYEDKSSEAQEIIADFHKFGFHPSSPLAPAKTSLINLSEKPDDLFSSFKKSTRGVIKKARRLGIKVEKTDQIDSFAKLWQAQIRRRGDWLAGTNEIEALGKAFAKNVHLLVTGHQDSDTGKSINAGVLLIRNGTTLHYMYATSTFEANRQGTPSLLVWEALKLGQNLGCPIFDFEGIYDSRFPKDQKSWQGFSKFKQGFDGKAVTYLRPFRRTSFLCKF